MLHRYGSATNLPKTGRGEGIAQLHFFLSLLVISGRRTPTTSSPPKSPVIPWGKHWPGKRDLLYPWTPSVHVYSSYRFTLQLIVYISSPSYETKQVEGEGDSIHWKVAEFKIRRHKLSSRSDPEKTTPSLCLRLFCKIGMKIPVRYHSPSFQELQIK